MSARISRRLPPIPPVPLSARETTVYHLTKSGRTVKQIAEELGISAGTVISHRRAIRQKVLQSAPVPAPGLAPASSPSGASGPLYLYETWIVDEDILERELNMAGAYGKRVVSAVPLADGRRELIVEEVIT